MHGSVTPAILLGKKFIYYDEVEIVSPFINKDVERYLNDIGFYINNMNKHYKLNGSLLTLESWFHPLDFKNGKEDEIIINFSQCFDGKADIYYAPGPITFALDDIYPWMRGIYKIVYKSLKVFINSRDRMFNERIRKRTKLFIAVSNYTAELYKRLNINVEGVIYPPLDLDTFKPSTSKPSEDYILTYIGKETRFDILNKIAKNGIRIKGFGSKISYIPSYIRKNHNIELLGRVSDDELVELYSNALYTIFPFTHEPFGYIPIESMACSAPVLTYNRQGPAETVNNDIGWVVNNDNEMVNLAIRLWNNGYDKKIRMRCKEYSTEFGIDNIVKKWKVILTQLIGSQQSL